MLGFHWLRKILRKSAKFCTFFSTANALLHAGAKVDGPGMLHANETQSGSKNWIWKKKSNVLLNVNVKT